MSFIGSSLPAKRPKIDAPPTFLPFCFVQVVSFQARFSTREEGRGASAYRWSSVICRQLCAQAAVGSRQAAVDMQHLASDKRQTGSMVQGKERWRVGIVCAACCLRQAAGGMRHAAAGGWQLTWVMVVMLSGTQRRSSLPVPRAARCPFPACAARPPVSQSHDLRRAPPSRPTFAARP